MIDWAELTLFIYITARMSGFLLFNPILGRRGIPGIAMSGIILLLSVSVISVTEQTVVVPDVMAELAVRIILELALGFLLGLVINFFLYVPLLAGEVIDTQMGMTMNRIYDAGSQINMSTTGALLNALMLLLFFAANGHYTLLRILLTSGELVSFGAVSLGDNIISILLEIFLECTVLGIKLCMPILAAELVGQLGMGVLMKVIPQINVFVINIDLKVIIGLVLLLLLIAPISEYLLQLELQMLESLSALLARMG